MGEGHFGGDGSVQSKVIHQDAQNHEVGGIGPIPMDQIGIRHGVPQTQDHAGVRERGPGRAPWEAAAPVGNQIVLHVPVVSRIGGANPKRPLEVNVEW